MFEVVDGLSVLPIDVLKMVKSVDSAAICRSVIQVAADAAREDEPALAVGGELDELDSGLHRSDEDGVFDYELPTGDRIEMVRVEKGEFSTIGPRLAPGYPGDDDPARIRGAGVPAMSE